MRRRHRMNKEIVVIGAGKIGRGSLGLFFSRAGWKVSLFGHDPAKMAELAAQGYYETRTETHYEEVEAFEEITRTKRNDLAPDEYEVPEGLTEVTIAAYDVYDDPIYKTLEL